jgi:hypothetical protein
MSLNDAYAFANSLASTLMAAIVILGRATARSPSVGDAEIVAEIDSFDA